MLVTTLNMCSVQSAVQSISLCEFVATYIPRSSARLQTCVLEVEYWRCAAFKRTCIETTQFTTHNLSTIYDLSPSRKVAYVQMKGAFNQRYLRKSDPNGMFSNFNLYIVIRNISIGLQFPEISSNENTLHSYIGYFAAGR